MIIFSFFLYFTLKVISKCHFQLFNRKIVNPVDEANKIWQEIKKLCDPDSSNEAKIKGGNSTTHEAVWLSQ